MGISQLKMENAQRSTKKEKKKLENYQMNLFCWQEQNQFLQRNNESVKGKENLSHVPLTPETRMFPTSMQNLKLLFSNIEMKTKN